MSFVELLTRDALRYLMRYLPTSDLCRIASVCRSWRDRVNSLAFAPGGDLQIDLPVTWQSVLVFIERVKPTRLSLSYLILDEAALIMKRTQLPSVTHLEVSLDWQYTEANNFLLNLIGDIPNCTSLIYRGTKLDEKPHFQNRYLNERPTKLLRYVFSLNPEMCKQFQLLIVTNSGEPWPAVYSDRSPENDRAIVNFLDDWKERISCTQELTEGLTMIRDMYTDELPADSKAVLQYMHTNQGCSNKNSRNGLCYLWYMCLDCNFTGMRGVCFYCHHQCHKEHFTFMKYVSVGAYCDCRFCREGETRQPMEWYISEEEDSSSAAEEPLG